MFKRIFSFLSSDPQPPGQTTAMQLRGEVERPPSIHKKVLMVVHNPTVRPGQGLREAIGWNDPQRLAKQYVEDVRTASHGIVQYEIVDQLHDDEFPRKIDGFQYSADQFMTAWRRRQGFHQPDQLDYPHALGRYDLVSRINRGEIDEVWFFGFPYAGYYESIMVGPGAFWCNAPGLDDRGFARRFVIMGFNYERGVGEMLENLGHRAESIMAHVYRHHQGDANLWERFIRTDQTNPGRAECGNVHFAPNSQRDYDWGNPLPVPSYADNWYAFPKIDGPPRSMSCLDWGNGDTRGHHLWWFDHFPHTVGQTDGISHNWWEYVIDPNLVT